MKVALEALPQGALGRPIRGPEAMSGDWGRFWHLTFNIARTQWKTRFFGSVLGYFWQLMRPLMLFGTLYVFFTKVGHIGQGPDSAPGKPDHLYGVQMLASIVLFTFFGEATSGSVRSVIDNEALVRKIQFPRLVIPLSVVLLALFNLGLNLIVLLVFALVSGVHPMLSWLQIPLIVAVLVAFSTGIAMLLSSMYVYFRDIAPIWEVFSQVLFYASPTIVPMSTVQKNLSAPLVHLYMISPLATVLQQFRHAVINHPTPGASAYLGGAAGLLEPLAVVVVLFVAGFVVFHRTAPYVAENL